MDMKILLASFGLVFLAELGDKTQLTALAFSASSRSPWSVFLGTSLALVTASAIAVLLGEALGRVLPPRLLRMGAAVAFVAVGVALLLNEARKSIATPESLPAAIETGGHSHIGAFVLHRVEAFENDLAEFAQQQADIADSAALRQVLQSAARQHRDHAKSLTDMASQPMHPHQTGQRQHADADAGHEAFERLSSRLKSIEHAPQPLAEFVRRQEAAGEFYIALARATIFHDARDVLRSLAMEEIRLAQDLCAATNHPDEDMTPTGGGGENEAGNALPV